MTSKKSDKGARNRFSRSSGAKKSAGASPSKAAAKPRGKPALGRAAGSGPLATSTAKRAADRRAPKDKPVVAKRTAAKPPAATDKPATAARPAASKAGRGPVPTAPPEGESTKSGRPRTLVSSNRRGPNAAQLRNSPTASAPPRRRSPATNHGAPPPPDWAPSMQDDSATDEHAELWTGHIGDPEDAPISSERPGPHRESPPGSPPDSGDYGMLGIGTRVLPPDMDFELFEEDSEPVHTPPSPEADAETVAERIRELEARLDGMMTTVTAPRDPVPAKDAERPRPGQEEELTEASAVEAARELLQSDYYRRKWGRASLRAHVEEVDDFGLAPDFEQRIRPLLKFLFRRYFRVETRGIDNIPSDGRAVVVANHSGTLPLDGVMLREALREHHPSSRDLRWLAEDFIFYLPFIGVAMNRMGAVRACQENAQRLLAKDHLIAVFPEGSKGIKKLYRHRYQLQRFGRGGYVRLCLRTQSPLVPCAIVGAEETNPMLYRLDNFSRLFGLQYLPVTPTFPWFGPLGLVPAPTKWRITFGEPIALDSYGPEAADDHVLIGRLSERVRASINSMLESSLRTRRSIWL